MVKKETIYKMSSNGQIIVEENAIEEKSLPNEEKSLANKIINEALRILENELTFSSEVNREYNDTNKFQATLTNSPAAGNPTKWIPINDNGIIRYFPVW